MKTNKNRPCTLRAKTQPNAATPWLDEDGKERSDDEIRVLGQEWSAETWERYLDRDFKAELDEKNVFTFPYVDTPRVLAGAELLEFLRESKRYPKMESAFLLALKELPEVQALTVKGLFWDDKSIQEIAKEVGTTPATIRAAKSRALKKLKELVPSKKFAEKLKRKSMLEVI